LIGPVRENFDYPVHVAEEREMLFVCFFSAAEKLVSLFLSFLPSLLLPVLFLFLFSPLSLFFLSSCLYFVLIFSSFSRFLFSPSLLSFSRPRFLANPLPPKGLAFPCGPTGCHDGQPRWNWNLNHSQRMPRLFEIGNKR